MTNDKQVFKVAAAMIGLMVVSGCQTDSREQLLKTGKSQVELRSFQSRTFDTGNKEQTLRTVIATLQDLSFVVDKADAVLGSVTASKLDHAMLNLPYQLRMTVTVRPRGVSQMIVRANATYNITPVEDPEPYQQFFTSLSKAMFLEANTTGGADYPVPQSRSRQASVPPSGPAKRFVSKASRDAWYGQAKQDVEQKYERLITTRRKERYGFGCDKSVKQARAQACQDVAFQIQLLQDTKQKELDALEQQYRRTIVKVPRPAREQETAMPNAGQPPPAQNATAAVALPPGSTINFEADRAAIEQAITNYYDLTGYTDDFPNSFNGAELYDMKALTMSKIEGDRIEVQARYTARLISAWDAGTQSRASRFTLRKENDAYSVIAMKRL